MTKQTNKVVDATSTEIDNELAVARTEVAEAVTRAYGAERGYASIMNRKYIGFDWFDIEHRDNSDNAKALQPEKKAFMLALNNAKHTNPSTVWARVRKYAREERYPEPETQEGEVTEAEQGESGKANAERSPMLRNIEELTLLYKFNMRQENLPQKIIDANAFIIKGLEALGVQINMLA